MSDQRSGGYGKRALFASVAVFLFFVVAEALLWSLGVETLLSERDPLSGFSGKVHVFEPDPQAGVYRTPRRAVLHSFNYQEFRLSKPENGYRLFVIGGSSAFGFPWGAEVAFTQALGDALRADLGERPVEVINAAAMSYGSHRLRVLVGELLQYEPDAILVYGGHNEFVERRFYRGLLDRSRSFDGVKHALSRSRLYSTMARAYESLASRRADAGEAGEQDTGDLLGLDVDRESATDLGQVEKDRASAQFEQNLRAIVADVREAGVALYICTVPSNIKDWIPNQSAFATERSTEERATVSRLLDESSADLQQGRAERAVERLERAYATAPEYAETSFRLGESYAALQRWEDARSAFVRARDLDSQPARALSGFNEVLRQVGAEPDVRLIDVERVFEAASPDGLLGFNLFEDYVHPNIQGHRLIALESWRALRQDAAGIEGVDGDVERFVEATGVDPREVVDPETAVSVAASAGRGPDMLYNLAVVLENRGLVEEAIEKYAACLRLRPQYFIARENLAHLLFKRGDVEGAARQYAYVLETHPDRVKSLIGLGESVRRNGDTDVALQALLRATQLDPASVDAWNSLGGIQAQLGRQTEAEAAFRRALELRPDAAEPHVNLGLNLLFQSRLDDADEEFRAALVHDPHNLRARNGIAAVLTERGELDEAERIFEENLALDPQDEFAVGGLRVIEERRRTATGN